MRKIVLSGGGTAGHVTPIIALLPFLSDRELHFIGTDGIESRLMKDYPQVKYHTIHCVKYVRNKIFANASVPIELIRSVSSARRILKEINPDTVFCKGGYVSLPVGLATAKPTRLITHESDISMGLTNRLIAGRCEKVCLSFDTVKHKNAVYTGAIIRQSIYKGNRIYPSPTLLVMGGSLGHKRSYAKGIARTYKKILRNSYRRQGKNRRHAKKSSKLPVPRILFGYAVAICKRRLRSH